MKMPAVFLSLLLSLLISGCDSGEESEVAPTKTIFKITSYFIEDRHDGWVILRTSDTGEIIEAKPTASGETLTFESDKVIANDKITVTLFHINPNNRVVADIYSGVDVGSVWIQGSAQETEFDSDRGDNIGTYKLSISGVPDDYWYSLSTKYFAGTNLSTSAGANTLSGEIPIYKKAKDYFLTINPVTGDPKYKIFNDLKDGDNFDLSYSDLDEFDEILDVKLPAKVKHIGYINAFESVPDGTSGFTIYNPSTFVDRTDVRLGYLDDFKYYTTLLITDDGFQYYSAGAPPKSIDYVSGDNFEVTDKSLKNFAFTSSVDYISSHVNYLYPEPTQPLQVSITYHNPKDYPKHFDPFTPELIQQFSIPVDKLAHWSSTFVVGSTNTYKQSLESVFGSTRGAPFSEVTINKYQ